VKKERENKISPIFYYWLKIIYFLFFFMTETTKGIDAACQTDIVWKDGPVDKSVWTDEKLTKYRKMKRKLIRLIAVIIIIIIITYTHTLSLTHTRVRACIHTCVYVCMCMYKRVLYSSFYYRDIKRLKMH
jgi:hypothetical protein